MTYFHLPHIIVRTDVEENREVGANRNAVNASAGGRAGPRQRMPDIREGGISKNVVESRLEGGETKEGRGL